MKKTLLATTLIFGLALTSGAYAATASLGNLKLNVNTPKTTKTTKATTTKTTSVNADKMKAQINALNSKLTSVSSSYEKTVNDLATNLLPANELTKYKEKVAKLKASASKNAEVNIDIAEDGTVAINNALKSNATDIVKNLTAAKKAAVKKDLSVLTGVQNNYTSIATQATNLASSIKADPVTALSLSPELITLTKNAKEAAKQAKNITKLTSTITTTLAKSGVNLK